MSSFIPIRLLGTSFSLRTEESPEYLEGVIKDFEKRLEETRNGIGISDPLKLSILTGILLTEELNRAKTGSTPQEFQNLRAETRELEILTKTLIDKIDSVL